MALQAKYTAFLADPTTDCLASNASLHYITTLTTLNEPAAILKHLKTQEQFVNKKTEKLLHVIENQDSLCIETETTLHFVLGGGTYLPGLDDNFLSDKIVTVPILHIVTFDSSQKIVQIRLHWDQACVLRAVDTIGARGRNWPIRPGNEQARLIATSTAAIPGSSGAAAAEEERKGRSMSRGVDPHASLALFAPRDVNGVSRDESMRNPIAPRASAKPAPREWGELFANGEPVAADQDPRSVSPSKLDNPIKSGAGKHHQDNRLFSPDNEYKEEKGIKTDAKKYSHFEFGEAEFKPSPIKNDRVKHMSQWDFQDFVTPQKVRERKTAVPSRNFDLNEVSGANNTTELKQPVFTQHVPQPRPSADAHFEFNDLTPESEKTQDRAMIGRTSKALGLYEDHILGFDEDVKKPATASGEQEKMPLNNITDTNAKANNSLRATFDAHWEAKDSSSPVPAEGENSANGAPTKAAPEATKRVARDMGAGWEHTDESPQPARGIAIRGDGMGGARTADKGWWDY